MRIIGALLFIALGAAACVFSDSIATSFHYYAGSVVGFVGIIIIFIYFKRKEYTEPYNNHFIIGAVNVVIAILIIAVPDRSMKFICVIWGAWSVLKAIFELNRLLQLKFNENKRILIKSIFAILELVLGVVLLLELTNALGHHIILLGMSFITGGMKVLVSLYKNLI